MIFKNEEHEAFFYECIEKLNSDKRRYIEYQSLFYTLGITKDCRDHIDSIFDFDEGYINPDVFRADASWMTGADTRLIRLAFSLYSDDAPTAYNLEGRAKEQELSQYQLHNLLCGFSDDNLDFVMAAIRFRYSR